MRPATDYGSRSDPHPALSSGAHRARPFQGGSAWGSGGRRSFRKWLATFPREWRDSANSGRLPMPDYLLQRLGGERVDASESGLLHFGFRQGRYDSVRRMASRPNA